MSKKTKKLLLTVSNAFYTLVDENGEWNEKGMKVVGWAIVVLLFISFYIMGGDI
ncbi:hypothetical protein JTF06_11930 [Desemzia sp. RIT804]|uniref:hypothetical protein n=1 Tax=Desemzia sp. RIT 804 TaxID=2810209 RepID=UPI0019506E2C|nr:hypothetical protein [Desemzia sp. RIT 804]MBM6615594.1 hypothetical protein [Desemzia sp. RIT 804]